MPGNTCFLLTDAIFFRESGRGERLTVSNDLYGVYNINGFHTIDSFGLWLLHSSCVSIPEWFSNELCKYLAYDYLIAHMAEIRKKVRFWISDKLWCWQNQSIYYIILVINVLYFPQHWTNLLVCRLIHNYREKIVSMHTSS